MGVDMMRGSLILDTPEGQVTILDEPIYSFRSTDHPRTYDTEIRLGDGNLYSSHGVRIDGKWSAICGAGGGPSAVDQHSAIGRRSPLSCRG